ncbi:MAG: PKD domain-containing protein [Chloroflexota bacterium]
MTHTQIKRLCLTLFCIVIATVTTTYSVYAQDSTSGSSQQLFLPYLTGGDSAGTSTPTPVITPTATPTSTPIPSDFSPTSDTQLTEDIYTFTSLTIPSGVTVTAMSSITIQVSEDVTIEGSLVADCMPIIIQGDGTLTINGTVSNVCPEEGAEGPDLEIKSEGGTLVLGSFDEPANLVTSGALLVTNVPNLPDWEFDVLEEERSIAMLPPICSARADTLWESAIAQGAAEINFVAEGVDPDGGQVTFEWNFGDGTTSTEQEPLHIYSMAGAYTPTVTVTDDDGQVCQASLSLIIDDGEDISDVISGTYAAPVLWIEPSTLVLPIDQGLLMDSIVDDPQGGDLTYAWDFGNGATSDSATGLYTYTVSGRYPISLTVTDADGNQATATSSVYVHDIIAEVRSAEMNAPQAICPPNPRPANTNLVNIVRDGGQAGPGRNGRSLRIRLRGNTIFGGGTDIKAQDGGDGADKNGTTYARGQNGGKGGSLYIGVLGRATFCAGATFSAGNGGKGGNAIATAPPGDSARAYGGRGGPAASRLVIRASRGIDIEGAITIGPGSGGNGGDGTATGGDGADDCNIAKNGGRASAYGGNGGTASKLAWAWGRVTGLNNITLVGATGGDGGTATSISGDGGNAVCNGTARGGDSHRSYARGGNGGNARLRRIGIARAVNVSPFAFLAGDGGEADATGGNGGNGIANPPGPCTSASASGGDGAFARAIGGKGGKGVIDGSGALATSVGGHGGNAKATGGDCTKCGNGGAATAGAGDGGGAYARSGRPTPMPDTTMATAGDAGSAEAIGGTVTGRCDQCPGGAGGNGGKAIANGGDGGTASGNGTKVGGDAGDADATGGDGADGANCCGPPHLQGGDGGNGGEAIAQVGDPGNPGGATANNGGSGGDGGNGGEGEGPGSGGSGGNGRPDRPNEVFDGMDGLGGPLCPNPTVTVTPTDVTPTATITVTTTPTDVTVTPTPTDVTVTPTPTPRPTLTEVEITVSMTDTTPSEPVTITVKPLDENGEPFDVDSFFDVWVEIDSREPISDRIPTFPDGEGGHMAVMQFPAGQFWVGAQVIPRDGISETMPIMNPIFVQSEPRLDEIVSLDLVASIPGEIAGLGNGFVVIPRDPFGNAVSHLPPDQLNCQTDVLGIDLLPLQPVPNMPDYLAIDITGSNYGVGNVTCIHTPTDSRGAIPIARAPWALEFENPLNQAGLGFPAGGFVNLYVEIDPPGDTGIISATGHLTVVYPFQFVGCNPTGEDVEVNCQQSQVDEMTQMLQFQVQTESPVQEKRRVIRIQLTVDRLVAELTKSKVSVLDFQIFDVENQRYTFDFSVFGPEWTTYLLTVKPTRTINLHIYRAPGAGASDLALDTDVKQAEAAFNLNGLICTCPFFVKFGTKTTDIPPADWAKIDKDNDGLDRYDRNNDGDFEDEGDNDDPKVAKDLGYFDNGADTLNIYYVPKIRGNALGVTYAPDGQAAVNNNADHDNWTLFHELIHALDLAKDGDFDVDDSPDDDGNAQGSRNPLNGMNYRQMGPFLTATQCAELTAR